MDMLLKRDVYARLYMFLFLFIFLIKITTTTKVKKQIQVIILTNLLEVEGFYVLAMCWLTKTYTYYTLHCVRVIQSAMQVLLAICGYEGNKNGKAI